MSRRTGSIALLALFVLIGCTHGSDGGDTLSRVRESPKSGDVRVVAGVVDAAYVAGDRAFGLGSDADQEKLAAPVNASLFATLAPAAVPGPPGSGLLAYNSWRGRRPILRVRDLQTDADRVLDDGAFSIAWRRDGALGYTKAVTPTLRSPARSPRHIVVRESLESRPVRWTSEPGRYVVAAWAGNRLIAYRLTDRWPDLLVLDDSGKVRVLAQAGALVALSPDGRRAFVSTYGASPPLVRILEVENGEEVATLTLAEEAVPPLDEPVRWIVESGSWQGDLVFAAVNEGVAVFRVGAADITLEQLLHFSPDVFPLGASEPRTERSGRRVVVWAQLQARPRQAIPPAAVVDCDRLTLQCRVGPEHASVPGPRLVYSPSRP